MGAQLKLAKKATAFLREMGANPRAVPLKTLVPLVELSSLEEEWDDEMVDRWAALLANASLDPKRVPPSFPRILSELSSNEARILQALYEWRETHTSPTRTFQR